MSSTTKDCFACNCLNVTVVVEVDTEDVAIFDAADDGSGKLKDDVKLRKGTLIQVIVSQPLLTSRQVSNGTHLGAKRSMTTLACLNCSAAVYTVDKVMTHSQSSSKTTVGFNQPSSSSYMAGKDAAKKSLSSGIVDPSAPAKRAMASSTAEDDLLRPDPIFGHLQLLQGILHGSKKLARMAASETYSKTFGLRIEKRRGENDLVDGLNIAMGESSTFPLQRDSNKVESSSATKSRSKSPSARSLLSAANESSSSISPSPARNTKSRALAYRTEEEDGDDPDTLHLLENLLSPLPSSIFQEGSLRSPYQQQTSSGSNRTQSPRRVTSSSYFPTQAKSPPQKRLEDQLDLIALTELRSHHEAAQREVYDLLKSKRKALAQIEERIRNDAKRLLGRKFRSSSIDPIARLTNEDIKEANKNVTGNPAEIEKIKENGSPFFERRRPLFPTSSDMMRTSSSQSAHGDNTSSSALGGVNTVNNIGTIIPGRAGTSSSSLGAKTGGYLSASFAMRGRDLPQELPPSNPDKTSVESKEDEEEWYAQKRRLRERYPHGDHSALPSAVNSDDEGNVEVKKDVLSEEDEEEQRGRGRGRPSARGSTEGAREAGNKIETRKANSRTDNSIQSKPSYLDVGDIRRAKMEAKYSSSSDESNKSTNAKKGALKQSTPVKSENKDKEKNIISGEKKVAFAEGPSQVVIASSALDVEPRSDPIEKVDESVDAVFEIDEEIDGDGTPGSSDISIDPRAAAMQQHKDALQNAKTEDESLSNEEDDTSPQQEINRGNVAQSLPSVGSFSALAHSEKFDKIESRVGTENAEGFDPASLRLDGQSVYTSQSTRLSKFNPLMTIKEVNMKANADDTSIYGSRPLPARKASFDLGSVATQAGFPSLRGENLSTIGFRVAVGEAEARLSGLLAPHIPSHRDLWSSSDKKKLKLTNSKESKKYKLKDDDIDETEEVEEDTVQEAYKGRIRTSQAQENSSSSGADAFARSVPIGMARNSLQEARRKSMAATSTSTIFYDSNSGFDLEPKTSLPYQEKKLTPSLRKATRHLTSSLLNRSAGQSSLATISDSSEVGSVNNQAESTISNPHIKLLSKEDMLGKQEYNLNLQEGNYIAEDLKPAIPAIFTRGFQSLTLATETVSMPTSTQSTPLLGSKGSEFGDVRASRKLMARGIYVQPPPPATAELRLTPSDENRPRGVKLEEALLDTTFATREEEEEEKGEEDYERDLKFMHTIEQLKINKRTGWYHHRIAQPESIADHMYRMAVLSMLLPNVGLDIGKCVQLCLVHDIAEALVGDLTPLDGVSREEKLQREKDALLYLVHDLLGASPAALRLEALWMEYEDRITPESKAVKDLDRFELCLQAVEYERKYIVTDLQPFFEGSLGFITHPRIRKWARRLAKEREQLWETTPFQYEQVVPAKA